MPHFKCVRCKTRLYSSARLDDLIGDTCPGCDSPLEPVGELTEIVGFQSITQRDGAADGDRPRRQKPFAGRVDALFAHREALLADVSPEAVAKAVALPLPDENP